MKQDPNKTGFRLVIPFFVTLAVLTVVSFIIPLRPTQSQMEKRKLQEFPAFSVDGLVSGDYFDEINLWFSDTFPGREGWLQLASFTSSLHGSSELAIEGDLPMELMEVPDFQEEPPVTSPQPELPEDTPPVVMETEPTKPEATEAEPAETKPVETKPAETEPAATEPAPTAWGGVDAANDEDILWTESVIQIGDSVFSALGFSQDNSRSYIAAINDFAADAEEAGITVVSAPPPTAVGILVEEEFQYKLRSSSQVDILRYLHDGISDSVVKVDTVSALLAHNDEYVYFRTDHHWTALGAYYAYEAVCRALGMEPVDIDTMEVIDMGDFIGSLYGRAKNPWKLKRDNLYVYMPQGDITNTVYYSTIYGSGQAYPMLTVDANWSDDSKYSVFGTDWPINHLENRDQKGKPNCIVVKDSFGNCFLPFLTQNFENIYAVDYRKFRDMPLIQLAETYDCDYVIFMPYLAATQSVDGPSMISNLCHY